VQVKMLESMKALSEARTAMADVHNGLAEAKLRLGVRTKMNIVEPVKQQATESPVTLRDVG